MCIGTIALSSCYRLCYNLRRKAPLDVYVAYQQMIISPEACPNAGEIIDIELLKANSLFQTLATCLRVR
jgi:hypothetical protein